MKFIPVLSMLLFSAGLKAQDLKGYYVTLNNDTVYTSYKFTSPPFFALRKYDQSDNIEIITPSKETEKLDPKLIKSFFINIFTQETYFVSMPRRNGKRKFFQAIASFPQFNLYARSIPSGGGYINEFALVKKDSSYVFVGPDDGNQKTRKRLRDFFADQPDILAVMSSIKELFTKPGFVQSDMERLIEKILALYKKE